MASDVVVMTSATDTYTISVEGGPGGSVGPNGGLKFVVGSDAVFQITADAGWRIDTVEIDGVAQRM